MLLSVFLLLWTANRNHQTSQQHVDKNHQCQGKILAEHVAPVCVTCKESCTEKNSACNMSIPLFPAHLIFCVYLSPTCFICCACISLGNYFSASLRALSSFISFALLCEHSYCGLQQEFWQTLFISVLYGFGSAWIQAFLSLSFWSNAKLK